MNNDNFLTTAFTGLPAPMLFDVVPDGLCLHEPDGTVIGANAAALSLFDRPAMPSSGLPPGRLGLDTPSLTAFGEAVDHLWAWGQPVRTEVTLTQGGQPRHIEIHLTVQEPFLLSCWRDVTDWRLREQALAWQAGHDALTGLINRTLLMDRMDHALRIARRNDHQAGVLFLDLDGFKAVNDTLGHQSGDELLAAVARRLRSAVRDSDTVARLGGDEFVVVLEGIHPQPEGADHPVIRVAEKIVELLHQPFPLGGRSVRVGASVGVCLFPDHGSGVQELLARADLALYRAKSAGKGRVWRYRKVDADNLVAA